MITLYLVLQSWRRKLNQSGPPSKPCSMQQLLVANLTKEVLWICCQHKLKRLRAQNLLLQVVCLHQLACVLSSNNLCIQDDSVLICFGSIAMHRWQCCSVSCMSIFVLKLDSWVIHMGTCGSTLCHNVDIISFLIKFPDFLEDQNLAINVPAFSHRRQSYWIFIVACGCHANEPDLNSESLKWSLGLWYKHTLL